MARKNQVRIPIVAEDKTKAAFKSVQSSMATLRGASASLAASMAPLLSVAAVAAGVRGFAGMTKSVIEAADGIQKLSKRLGVSTEALSQYQHVAELSGTSFSSLTKGLQYMQKNLSDAQDGLTTSVRAFDNLGLSVSNLVAQRPEDAFEAIGAAIAGIEDEARRTQVAMQIFGRAGVELIPVFSDGAAAVREMREEADRLGKTIGQDMADRAAAATDSMTRFTATVDGAKAGIVEGLLPALVDATGPMDKFSESVGKMRDRIALATDTGAQVAKGIGALNRVAKAMMGDFSGLNSNPLDGLADSIDGVSQAQARYLDKTLGTGIGDMLDPPRIAEAAAGTTAVAEAIDRISSAAATVPRDWAAAFTVDDELQHLLDLGSGLHGPDMNNSFAGVFGSMAAVTEAAEGAQGALGVELKRAAEHGASGMASAVGNAVAYSTDALESLENVARGIFGSIVTGLLDIGISAGLAAITGGPGAVVAAVGPSTTLGLPLGNLTASAGGDRSKSAPRGTVINGGLTVAVQGTMDLTDPMAARRLAERIEVELETIQGHHGAEK